MISNYIFLYKCVARQRIVSKFHIVCSVFYELICILYQDQQIYNSIYYVFYY
jgi:hypothetical protein